MSGLLRNHRAILYQLRRDWGLNIFLYRPLTATQNVESGVIVRSFKVYSILRAPVLPADGSRSFVYDLAYIAVGKNFTEGAFFDKEERLVIIDALNLPSGIVPTEDDFLVFSNRRYTIKTIQMVEEFAAYRLRVVALDNQNTEKWAVADSKVSFMVSV